MSDDHLACDSEQQYLDYGVDIVAENHFDEFDADDNGHGGGEVGLEGVGRGHEARDVDIGDEAEGRRRDRDQDADADEHLEAAHQAIEFGM